MDGPKDTRNARSVEWIERAPTLHWFERMCEDDLNDGLRLGTKEMLK